MVAPNGAMEFGHFGKINIYNLGVLLRQDLLPAEYRTSKVATLRWQIYRLAGKLVYHGRQWTLKIETDGEKLAMLMAARQRCYELSG